MNKSFLFRYSLLTILVIILFLSLIFCFIIPYFEKSFIDQRKKMICELVNSQWHTLLKLDNDVKKGILTLAQAQNIAIDHINTTRYGSEKKEYFWIHDIDGIMVTHPYKSELNETNIIKFQDPTGKFLVQEINKTIKRNGSGFVEYMWQKNENLSLIAEKISYVKYFEPWKWIIGTGSYIYDIEEEIQLIRNKLVKISLIIIFFAALILIYLLFEHSKTEFKRKFAEETVLAQLNELTIKNAELEEFSYTISHDLKNPIITIKGYSELLINYLNDKKFDRMENYIKKIENAILKMQKLLDSLLKLAKIGKIINPPEYFPAGEVIKEAIENLHCVIENSKADIKIMPEMPLIYADRQRILEVFQNLIENAVKYSCSQKKPEIEIGFNVKNSQKTFFVKDNGIGVPKEYQDKIFKVFQKLDLNTEGCGTGLAISKKIIEVHGGHISVESNGINSGSVFSFTIPETR